MPEREGAGQTTGVKTQSMGGGAEGDHWHLESYSRTLAFTLSL